MDESMTCDRDFSQPIFRSLVALATSGSMFWMVDTAAGAEHASLPRRPSASSDLDVGELPLSRSARSLQHLMRSGWTGDVVSTPPAQLVPIQIQNEAAAQNLADLIRQERVTEPRLTTPPTVQSPPRVGASHEEDGVTASPPVATVFAPVKLPPIEKYQPLLGHTNPQTSVVSEAMETQRPAGQPKSITEQTSAPSVVGLHALALDSLTPPPPCEMIVDPSPNRLSSDDLQGRENIRQTLQTAVGHFVREEIKLARQVTIEALGQAAAMLDARDGGSEHSKQLAMARDTIEHFGGPYLSLAEQQLVAACGSLPEASDSLVLMGKVERKLGESRDDRKAVAVAMTYYRAATGVDPNNAVAHRELGKTLFAFEAYVLATESLGRAVELQPDPDTYQWLLKASQRSGDVVTAQQCQLALNDSASGESLASHGSASEMVAVALPSIDPPSPSPSTTNATVSMRQPEEPESKQANESNAPFSQIRAWLPRFRRP